MYLMQIQSFLPFFQALICFWNGFVTPLKNCTQIAQDWIELHSQEEWQQDLALVCVPSSL